MIFFQLGREFKLSIAEISQLLPSAEVFFYDKQVLLLSGVTVEEVLVITKKLGGTIKIGTIIEDSIVELAIKHIKKFTYGISIFGGTIDLKKEILNTKKELKKNSVSSRFINKDFQNLSSAQIIGEKLVKNESDFSIVKIEGTKYIFRTIWIQDIESYSKRDYSKDRDMNVGMLPPKLCQIMLNLAGGEKIYDPFVGLGTILIESAYMGKKDLYGSDLSENMVEISSNNLKNLSNLDFKFTIEKLNAKFIDEFKSLCKVDSIVTEGYLGEIMTRKNISKERIIKQRNSLEKIYIGFFESLIKANYKGNIVICFPFWEINKIYHYFEEIYSLIEKYSSIQQIFSNNYSNLSSKEGSLLYKRDNQLVGREIFKLKIK